MYVATPAASVQLYIVHQLPDSIYVCYCPHPMECPPAAGRYLATADRDNKVRVSVLPAEPLKVGIDILAFNVRHFTVA